MRAISAATRAARLPKFSRQFSAHIASCSWCAGRAWKCGDCLFDGVTSQHAAQRQDQLELRGDDINDESKPRLSREVEPILGFTLHVSERISSRKKIRV